MSKISEVIIVPHTHWDREWYQSFQEYRLRLLKTVDKLLQILQKDPNFAYFHFDGQVVPIEDYLELRPENKGLLLDFIKQGRIGIGPWYIQPDEWLSYPEAIVRNLLFGRRIAEELGVPVVKIGYTPDTFGHTPQLPQIFEGFDINSFLFMRGMGDEGESLGDEFIWQAPNGSKIIAVHLRIGYSNGIFLGAYVGHPHIKYYEEIYPSYVSIWKSGLIGPVMCFEIYDKEPPVNVDNAIKQIRWLEEVTNKIKSSILLVLNGGDHAPPQEKITSITKSLKKEIPDVKIHHGRLEDYISKLRSLVDQLPTFKGELRGARYHWIIPNTLSTRIPQIKIPNYLCYTSIVNYLEPLSVLCWITGDEYPEKILRYLWKIFLQNLAHDSICGCGVDEVHRDVAARFRYIIDISKNLIYDKLHLLASKINMSKLGDSDAYVLVFNPLGWTRTDIVSVYTTDLAYGSYDVLDIDGSRLPCTIGGGKTLQVFSDKRIVELIFLAKNIPPLGYKVFRLHRTIKVKSPLIVQGTMIENEFFRIEADPNNGGLLKIVDKRNNVTYDRFNFFVDEGDVGDEYTFCPPLKQFIVTNNSVKANVWIEKGEAYSCLNIEFKMKVPESSNNEKRSERHVDLSIRERIYLYPKVPRIDFHIIVDNKARNHRFRIAFPTGLQIEHSYADTHYYVVKRSIAPPKGDCWQESPPVDHPLLYWVDVSDGDKGVMVATRGLNEYHLDRNGTLYITLLRCVDSIGKSDLLTRPGKFQLNIPTPDAQCIGEFDFQISVIPHKGDWQKDTIFREALSFAVPLLGLVTSKHEGMLPAENSLLTIEPDQVIITSLKKAEKDDAIILRCYNASEKPVSSKIVLDMLKEYIKDARKAKLSEEDIERVTITDDGRIVLRCGPWEITTIKLYKKKPS